ncbi:MAG: hypothetical protein M1826_005285 [Phylliscum demangeonii]|nr:MAG: hypothetical protein M1826_005285 [Phylliscum demangeonii]
MTVVLVVTPALGLPRPPPPELLASGYALDRTGSVHHRANGKLHQHLLDSVPDAAHSSSAATVHRPFTKRELQDASSPGYGRPEAAAIRRMRIKPGRAKLEAVAPAAAKPEPSLPLPADMVRYLTAHPELETCMIVNLESIGEIGVEASIAMEAWNAATQKCRHLTAYFPALQLDTGIRTLPVQWKVRLPDSLLSNIRMRRRLFDILRKHPDLRLCIYTKLALQPGASSSSSSSSPAREVDADEWKTAARKCADQRGYTDAVLLDDGARFAVPNDWPVTADAHRQRALTTTRKSVPFRVVPRLGAGVRAWLSGAAHAAHAVQHQAYSAFGRSWASLPMTAARLERVEAAMLKAE